MTAPARGTGRVLRVAVATPLYQLFDYLLPPDWTGPAPPPGVRLRVPFGRALQVGLLVECAVASELPTARLRSVVEVLDSEPVLPAGSIRLVLWAARYYHYPAGDALLSALPAPLRRGAPARSLGVRRWRVTAQGRAADGSTLARAPSQRVLLAALVASREGLGAAELREHPTWRRALAQLLDKGLAECSAEWPDSDVTGGPLRSAPELSSDQQAAVAEVDAARGGFRAYLLDGVTGSGKTEVYLRLIERVLARGAQALVLVPEISLTPQLVSRFRHRLHVAVAVLHSGLSDRERLGGWLGARDGRVGVVIGTRSAVYTPLREPGIIVVDEEHDGSLKQQDGLRYSARDVAVVRAQLEGLPVVLGSATPSLESLYNVARRRYHRLALPERAGGAVAPGFELVDLRRQPLEEGLAPPLLAAVEGRLEQGEQVLLFVNRRGYAPTLLCHECGWVASCRRCDAHLVLHRSDGRLRCHHCGSERPVDRQCRSCGSVDLRAVGIGTQRVEQALLTRFPGARVARIDRDSLRRKGAMEQAFADARSGRSQILVGTQMLAKGHHFPDVTLVGILDADGGLFSADFRGPERMAQLLLQVAGRAGRAEKPGRVLVQTHHPEHPLLQMLIHRGYSAFAVAALQERREAGLPPYSSIALLRAEATTPEAPLQFLQAARQRAAALGLAGAQLLGPVPAPMERRAGRVRAQLLVQCARRSELQRLLALWVPGLAGLPGARKVRWSLDRDPVQMY